MYDFIFFDKIDFEIWAYNMSHICLVQLTYFAIPVYKQCQNH